MSDGNLASIAILDNDDLTLAALRTWLHNNLLGAEVAWTANDARQAVSAALSDNTCPDVLVTDMSLNELSGEWVIRSIREHTANVPILAITSFPLTVYAEAAARARAQGIIAKRDLNAICNAISVVLQNRTWTHGIERGIAELFLPSAEAHRRIMRGEEGQGPRLTEREETVIGLFAQGLTSKQVAERLGLTENTIKTYSHRIFERLGAANRGQAIAIWMTGGMSGNNA